MIKCLSETSLHYLAQVKKLLDRIIKHYLECSHFMSEQ
jgi:hypothetical protein